MGEKSIVGDLINFRGLVYAPVNENGVVFLFGKIADDLNMYIEEIKPGFPDCIARRFVGKGWERVSIEFEYKSSNFLAHKHDATQCDMIVCWEHDWKNCPLEVIELKSEIQGFENYLIKRPGTTDKQKKDMETSLEKLFDAADATVSVRKWYGEIFEKLTKLDSSIWAKFGTKYIGWYSPEKAFVSLRIKKMHLRIECFSRGEDTPGTSVVSQKHAPRWVKFSVRSEQDVAYAVQTLSESYHRIKEAIKHGEPTGYFSGGEPFGAEKDMSDDDDE